ncbi:hypothetical protein [Saccharothrix deserti]|uniref:hypothetical protein n=1 Tax=Saccharothrix deserti TaxID=2593674 RepID=UPI00131CD31A|nr:hypothetical protein [Saccharothrix deserti]
MVGATHAAASRRFVPTTWREAFSAGLAGDDRVDQDRGSGPLRHSRTGSSSDPAAVACTAGATRTTWA